MCTCVSARVHACMRACTSGGLMGPANDYWPADLGGTSSPAVTHLQKRARARARPRPALTAPPLASTTYTGRLRNGYAFSLLATFAGKCTGLFHRSRIGKIESANAARLHGGARDFKTRLFRERRATSNSSLGAIREIGPLRGSDRNTRTCVARDSETRLGF